VHADRGPGASDRMVFLRGCCEGVRGQDFMSMAVLGRLRCLEYLRGPGIQDFVSWAVLGRLSEVSRVLVTLSVYALLDGAGALMVNTYVSILPLLNRGTC
jgi:hypothetical protein